MSSRGRRCKWKSSGVPVSPGWACGADSAIVAPVQPCTTEALQTWDDSDLLKFGTRPITRLSSATWRNSVQTAARMAREQGGHWVRYAPLWLHDEEREVRGAEASCGSLLLPRY